MHVYPKYLDTLAPYKIFSKNRTQEPIHKISILIAYAQKPPLNPHDDKSNRARDLNFGQSLHLLSHFVFASSKYSGKSTPMCMLKPWLLPDGISTKISCACPRVQD